MSLLIREEVVHEGGLYAGIVGRHFGSNGVQDAIPLAIVLILCIVQPRLSNRLYLYGPP